MTPAKNSPDETPRTSRSVRVTLRLLAAGGCVLLLCCGGCGYRLWKLSDPDEQITVSPETTFFTEPLTDDGAVDYVAALDARLSEGVTPENNAVVLLVQAFGPGEILEDCRSDYFRRLGIPELDEEGEYFVHAYDFSQSYDATGDSEEGSALETLHDDLDAATTNKWKRADYPLVADLIDQNEGPLAVIIEASRRPKYFSPGTTDSDYGYVWTWYLPIEQELQRAKEQLAARAMLRLGEGDLSGSWEDLLTCHRLARLVGQSYCLITFHIAVDIDMIARDDVYLADPRVTAATARRNLAELEALPPLPRPAELVDVFERLAFLDEIRFFVDGGRTRSVQFGEFLGEEVQQQPDGGRSLTNAVIDWDIALRMANEQFDEIVAQLRRETFPERAEGIDKVSRTIRAYSVPQSIESLIATSFFADRETVSRIAGEYFIYNHFPGVSQSNLKESQAAARQRLIRIGFALAIHQREQGEFPESLDALVPDPLDELPLDPYTSQPFIYQRTEDAGFRLYSVGENLQDDGGASFDDEPPGDDIIIEVRPE